jgi:hypothetical protein
LEGKALEESSRIIVRVGADTGPRTKLFAPYGTGKSLAKVTQAGMPERLFGGELNLGGWYFCPAMARVFLEALASRVDPSPLSQGDCAITVGVLSKNH